MHKKVGFGLILFIVFSTAMLNYTFAAQPLQLMDSIKHEKIIRPIPKNKLAKRSLRLTALGYLTLMIPVLGIASPFFIIGGIVSAIIALTQISKTHESGKELAIISLVFGGLYIVVIVAVLVAILSLFA